MQRSTDLSSTEADRTGSSNVERALLYRSRDQNEITIADEEMVKRWCRMTHKTNMETYHKAHVENVP